jgi:hypothetical protein
MQAVKAYANQHGLIGAGVRLCAGVLLLSTMPTAQAGDVSPAPSTPRTGSVGFLGDRTGVYPDCHPPTRWADYEPVTVNHKPAPGRLVNRNICWRADLANWGNGAPVPAGDRVFVVCEPGWKHVWPVLQCFGVKDGKLLWERELDPLDALSLSPQEKTELLTTWKEYWRIQREHWSRSYRYNAAPKEEKEALAAKFKAEDKSYKGGTGYTGARTVKSKELSQIVDRMKKWFKTTGITNETWNFDFGTWVVGYASPTPVSDGERVYVATGLAAFFCFDLDGKRLWVRSKPGIGAHFCNHYRSPLLYGDLFISDLDSVVRAYDKRTGELKWCHGPDVKTQGRSGPMSPVVIRCGNQDVLLSAISNIVEGKRSSASSGLYGMRGYLLPDGTPLEGGLYYNVSQVLVDTDRPDTVFFSGGGNHTGTHEIAKLGLKLPLAMRFSLDGKRLVSEVLWSNTSGFGKSGGSYCGLVYHDGKLYCDHAGAIFDARTGEVLAGGSNAKQKQPSSAVPACQHDGTWLIIAGGHLYGLGNRRGDRGKDATAPFRNPAVVEVFSLDGKKVAENRLWTPLPEGEKLEQIQCMEGLGGWNWFNQSGFISVQGDQIFIRSNDELWCIGQNAAGKELSDGKP